MVIETRKLSLAGIYVGQAIVAIFAVQSISGEYSTGMIRTTLTAIPRRPKLLAAKAAILTVLILAAGTVGVLVLAAWATAAWLIGGLLLKVRDA